MEGVMSISNLKNILMAAAMVAAVTANSSARASMIAFVPPSEFNISWTINLQNYAVSDIMMFEQIAGNGYGVTWASPDPGFNAPVGTTTITDPFTKYQPIAETFLIGVTSGLPGDAPGQQHLVLFTNTAWAASAQGVDWGTLFTTTLEDTLIADAASAYSTTTALSDVSNFVGGDAIYGTNGSIAFAPGQAFTAIAFSNGQVIGGGTSFVTNVPEPSTWAMMLVGFAGLGFAGYRRSKAVAKADTLA
jgi:hypothetical protein